MARTAAVAGLAVLLAGEASAASPWVPESGDLHTATSFVYQTFDEFYASDSLNDFPPGRLNQYSTRLFVDYGLGYGLAFDADLGFTATQADGLPDQNGLDDTHLGLRWRLVDEFAMDQPWAPTLALRVGGIIAGSYDTDNFPAAPGVGGSGFESNVALGKLLPCGFSLSSDFAYRIRDNDVPDDWRIRATVGKTLFEHFSVEGGIHHKESIDGIDLDDAGFAPNRAPELREIYTNLEAALSAIGPGDLQYNLFYAYTLDGRNTGKKHIVGASISVPFRFARE